MSSEEQLVEDENFENMLRPHRATLSPRCVERLKTEAGLDVTQKLRHRYPRKDFDAALKVLAEEVYASRSLEEATRQIGEDLIAPFQASLMGKAILSVVKLIPLKSSLQRLPGYLRTGNNYLEATVVETGPQSYELTINEMGAYPQYWVGVMLSGNRVLGYLGSTVTLKNYDGHRGTLAVSLKK